MTEEFGSPSYEAIEMQSSAVEGAVSLSWDRFTDDMNRQYPQSTYSIDALYSRFMKLQADAETHAARQDYMTAAELRANARDVAALLAARGEEEMERIAGELKADMASVIVGHGPQPWIVSSRHWQTHEKIDLVVNDDNVNMTRLAEWTHAAKSALPSYLTPSMREQIEIELATPERNEPDFG